MSSLKSCPFCGGVAKLIAPNYEYYSPFLYKCTQCGAEGPTKSVEFEAKKGWNARAQKDKWISVKDRMPPETHSLFWPLRGKKEWSKAMWLEQSDKVLVTLVFKNGTKFVATGETYDGVWNTSISRALAPIVTHWMPMPEPAKEDEDEAD